MKKNYWFFYVLFFTNVCFAQDDVKLNQYRSIFKISTIQGLIGEYSVFLEQNISKRMSFEIGGGLTVSEQEVFNLSKNKHSTTYQFGGSKLPTFAYSDFGYTLKGAVKVYASNKRGVSSGLYVFPQFSYKLYQNKFVGIDENGQTQISEINSKDWRLNLSFNLGYQFWIKRLSIDCFVGMKFIHQNQENVMAVQFYENSEWAFYWERLTPNYKTNRLTAAIGVKIGLGVNK